MAKITHADKITCIVANILPRYWEDAAINNIKDVDGTSVPGREKNGRLLWIIEIESGKIINWVPEITANTYYKVCDDGHYTLFSSNGKCMYYHYAYVPSCLSDGKGYGDYVIMSINEQGYIKDWNKSLVYQMLEEE